MMTKSIKKRGLQLLIVDDDKRYHRIPGPPGIKSNNAIMGGRRLC